MTAQLMAVNPTTVAHATERVAAGTISHRRYGVKSRRDERSGARRIIAFRAERTVQAIRTAMRS